jgi:hypothetical protein
MSISKLPGVASKWTPPPVLLGVAELAGTANDNSKTLKDIHHKKNSVRPLTNIREVIVVNTAN